MDNVPKIRPGPFLPFASFHTHVLRSPSNTELGVDSSLQLPCDPNELGTTHLKDLPSKSTSLSFHSEILPLGIHFHREVDVSRAPEH